MSRKNTVLENKLYFMEWSPILKPTSSLSLSNNGQSRKSYNLTCMYLSEVYLIKINYQWCIFKVKFGHNFSSAVPILTLGKFYSILSTYDANTVRTKLLRSWQKYSWFQADFFFQKVIRTMWMKDTKLQQGTQAMGRYST